jgi:hypothetical protein
LLATGPLTVLGATSAGFDFAIVFQWFGDWTEPNMAALGSGRKRRNPYGARLTVISDPYMICFQPREMPANRRFWAAVVDTWSLVFSRYGPMGRGTMTALVLRLIVAIEPAVRRERGQRTDRQLLREWRIMTALTALLTVLTLIALLIAITVAIAIYVPEEKLQRRINAQNRRARRWSPQQKPWTEGRTTVRKIYCFVILMLLGFCLGITASEAFGQDLTDSAPVLGAPTLTVNPSPSTTTTTTATVTVPPAPKAPWVGQHEHRAHHDPCEMYHGHRRPCGIDDRDRHDQHEISERFVQFFITADDHPRPIFLMGVTRPPKNFPTAAQQVRGAPGPTAGAGVPVLLAAGAVWLWWRLRRRVAPWPGPCVSAIFYAVEYAFAAPQKHSVRVVD